MKISFKLSAVFSIAALFLLSAGIAAVLTVNRLDQILNQTTYFNQQLDQVGAARRALRVSPERKTDHIARFDDMRKWARTDEERALLDKAHNALVQGGSVADAATQLEKLGAYYCQAMDAAHRELLTLHHRIVIGIIFTIVSSLVLCVALTWLVRHWLLNPVVDLSESIAVLATGQTDHKIRCNAGKEFDDIASSLNTLAGKLRDSESRVSSSEKFALIGEACTHVTHNVRSLLTAIRSLAQHESNAAHARNDSRVGFNYIIASVNKLDGWVRDLHAAVAPHNPNRVPLQVEPVIHDALSLLQPRLHERNLTIDYQAPDELPNVVVDRSLFEQAFIAVVTNAIEASPDNGRISVILKNGQPDRVTVQIQDEGPGMTDVTRAHAFEPFFTTKPENTGLGLTIAQAVVQRHGGEIQIENAAEAGTRVSIQLPVAPKRN